MPAIWSSGDATEGGLKGITQFVGKLSEVEEDVEGKDFGNGARLQLALHFYDVEVEESVDEVSLEDGKYTDWINQSSRKGSVNVAWLNALEEFCEANDLDVENLPDCIYDTEIRFRREVLVEGNEERNLSPGKALIPVEIVGKESKSKGRSSSSKGKSSTKEEKPARSSTRSRKAKDEEEDEGGDHSEGQGELDSGFIDFVVEAVGEYGSTRDLLRREIVKKSAMRKIMTEFGGLDAVLEYLVEHDHITEDDGTYFQVEE